MGKRLKRWGLGVALLCLCCLVPGVSADAQLEAEITNIYPQLATDPQGAWRTLESLRESAQAAPEATTLVRWYLAAAYARRALGDLEQADLLAARSLALADQLSDQEGIFDAMLLHGQILSARGRYREALAEFNRVIELSRDESNLRFAAAAHAGLGEAHTVQGDYAAGIAALLQAYQMYRAMQQQEGMRSTSMLLGNLYAEIDEPGYALKMYTETAALDRKNRDNLSLAVTLYNIGRAYTDGDDMVAAREHYREALTIARGAASRVHEAHILFGIGLSYAGERDWNEAERVLRQAASAAGDISDDYLLGRIDVQLAAVATATGRHAEALQRLEQSLATMEAAAAKRDLAEIRLWMARNLAAMGEFEPAYRQVLMHSELIADVASTERARRTAALRVRFDSARVESEKDALSRENTLKAELLDRERRFGRISAVGSILLLLIAGALAYSFKRQKSLERRLTELANTDGLTGLINRRRTFEIGSRELERAHRYGKPLALLAIDVDFFKAVNDRYGHPVGDQVLVALTRQWLLLLRGTDYLGRCGGEEFVAILPEAGEQRAAEVASRLRRETAALSLADCGVERDLTISVGVAWLQRPEDGFQELFNRADAALYAAKFAGRNRVATSA